jgi:hypothetical protein
MESKNRVFFKKNTLELVVKSTNATHRINPLHGLGVSMSPDVQCAVENRFYKTIFIVFTR